MVTHEIDTKVDALGNITAKEINGSSLLQSTEGSEAIDQIPLGLSIHWKGDNASIVSDM